MFKLLSPLVKDQTDQPTEAVSSKPSQSIPFSKVFFLLHFYRTSKPSIIVYVLHCMLAIPQPHPQAHSHVETVRNWEWEWAQGWGTTTPLLLKVVVFGVIIPLCLEM